MRFLNPVGVTDHGDQMSVMLIKFCMGLAVFCHVAFVNFDGITCLYFSGIDRCHVAASPIHAFHCKMVWLLSGCVFMFVTKQLIPDFGGMNFLLLAVTGIPFLTFQRPSERTLSYFWEPSPC